MPSRSRSIRTLIAIAAASLVATLAAAAPASGKSGSQVGFGKPVFVDTALAGGEPFVIYSHKGHDLIYSSHEGTTHLFRDGVITGPGGVAAFAANYRNQVNIWTSHDDGKTWQRVNYNGTGFFTNPAKNTGFSDPDLTEDEGGVIYDTGIDLANDALFSTPDGGKTWPTGTVQCHEGDRPAATKPASPTPTAMASSTTTTPPARSSSPRCRATRLVTLSASAYCPTHRMRSRRTQAASPSTRLRTPTACSRRSGRQSPWTPLGRSMRSGRTNHE
jgi:hypothetical protein